MQENRNALGVDAKSKLDIKIFNRIVNSNFYKKANCIFTFVSFGSEIDTHVLIELAIGERKTVCVPKVISKEAGMKAVRINSFVELKPGRFGILEPGESCPEVPKQDIDLVLVPGLAFDRKGGRIGYGAGFYDRFLMDCRKTTLKVGVAYDFQVLSKVPTDELDVRLDAIVTNQEVIFI
jgi:5-formyltetrahydrofolate cyclo-ligase